jgi:hypothetical protein
MKLFLLISVLFVGQFALSQELVTTEYFYPVAPEVKSNQLHQLHAGKKNELSKVLALYGCKDIQFGEPEHRDQKVYKKDETDMYQFPVTSTNCRVISAKNADKCPSGMNPKYVTDSTEWVVCIDHAGSATLNAPSGRTH